MGGVHARTDQAVAHIVARADGDGSVRRVAVVGVYRVVDARVLRAADELVGELAVVGTALVLGADGHLTLCAADVVAHTAHVYGEQFDRVVGNAARTAVTDLLEHGEEHVNAALELDALLADPLGKR